jgi:PAS domain S-box-containing protein
MVSLISPRALLAVSQWQIVFFITAFLIPACLLIGLFITRAKKRQVEIECERLKRLAETEHKRLTDLITNVPGIVWETRIDPVSHHHTTTFVSEQAEKMLGYTSEEWLSTPDFCICHVHEDDRERVVRETKEILSGVEQGHLSFRWLAKDGSTVWVKAQLAAIVDESGKIIGSRGVTINMTEQQLAENARLQTIENNRTILEALGRNEAQLSAIIESALDGIITIDEKQNIVLFNAAAEKLFLCSSVEAQGRSIDRFIPERFRVAHDQYIRGFGEEHGPPRLMGSPGELYGLRTSGEEFPIEASISQIEFGGQKFYTVILRDVTTAKQAVDRLRASEERFAKAFRANPQPMSLTTLATGLYIDVNESFLAMSGYTREEVIGHTSLQLRIWKTPDARAEFIRHLNEQGSLVNYETKFRTKSGSFRVLLSSAEK